MVVVISERAGRVEHGSCLLQVIGRQASASLLQYEHVLGAELLVEPRVLPVRVIHVDERAGLANVHYILLSNMRGGAVEHDGLGDLTRRELLSLLLVSQPEQSRRVAGQLGVPSCERVVR